RRSLGHVDDDRYRPVADAARPQRVRADGHADDRKRTVLTSDRAEPRAFEHDIDADERLSGRAIDDLPGDRTRGLLRAHGSRGRCGAQEGAGKREEAAERYHERSSFTAKRKGRDL